MFNYFKVTIWSGDVSQANVKYSSVKLETRSAILLNIWLFLYFDWIRTFPRLKKIDSYLEDNQIKNSMMKLLAVLKIYITILILYKHSLCYYMYHSDIIYIPPFLISPLQWNSGSIDSTEDLNTSAMFLVSDIYTDWLLACCPWLCYIPPV